MSWGRRAIKWCRRSIDRVYLTALYLGPRTIIHIAAPAIAGIYFCLKALRLIRPPEWLSALGYLVLFASVVYTLYLQRQLRLGRFRRDSNEASPPP